MQVRSDVPLATLTTLGVGGPAARLVEVTDAAELVAAVRDADEAGRPLLLLGGGSNVVAPDEGWPGRRRPRALARDRARPRRRRAELEVQAGEPWEDLVAHAVAEGLAGIEALAGIPGSTGATPVQNVGAYGQEVAQVVTTVRVWDRAEKRERTLTNAECGFAYRDSRLKREPGRFVVLTVGFALEESAVSRPVGYAELARALGVQLGETAPLAAVREAVLGLRRGKGMVWDPADPDTRSAGSFFTNPVVPADARGRGLPQLAGRRRRGQAQRRLAGAVRRLRPGHPPRPGGHLAPAQPRAHHRARRDRRRAAGLRRRRRRRGRRSASASPSSANRPPSARSGVRGARSSLLALRQSSRWTLCWAACARGRTTSRSTFTWCGRVSVQAMQSATSSATSGSRTPR